MRTDHDARPDQTGMPLWGSRASAELEEAHPFEGTGWWLSGGAGLLAWTALALLLTGSW